LGWMPIQYGCCGCTYYNGSMYCLQFYRATNKPRGLSCRRYAVRRFRLILYRSMPIRRAITLILALILCNERIDVVLRFHCHHNSYEPLYRPYLPKRSRELHVLEIGNNYHIPIPRGTSSLQLVFDYDMYYTACYYGYWYADNIGVTNVVVRTTTIPT